VADGRQSNADGACPVPGILRPGAERARAWVFEIHMSNSPRLEAHHVGIIGIMDAGMIHRPRKSSGAGRRLHFLLPQAWGRGAPVRRNVLVWHLLRVPPAVWLAGAPSGAPPWRFLTRPPDFFAGPKGSSHSRYQAAFTLPFIRRVAATEGGPLIGAAGDLAPWDGLQAPPAGATPCSAN